MTLRPVVPFRYGFVGVLLIVLLLALQALVELPRRLVELGLGQGLRLFGFLGFHGVGFLSGGGAARAESGSTLGG